jgi:hypothetical protein
MLNWQGKDKTPSSQNQRVSLRKISALFAVVPDNAAVNPLVVQVLNKLRADVPLFH